MDLRAIVRERMIAQHGIERGAMTALAALVAPRWGVLPSYAVQRLSRWFAGTADPPVSQIEVVLDVLGPQATPVRLRGLLGATLFEGRLVKTKGAKDEEHRVERNGGDRRRARGI